ncbi:GDSL-type esterase/lipase family protein [Puniceicoccus vermicola]|uniref:GDSL family lipase n=1 Tax=Puniceicoccus vermicola TaxID=388746 RepID=A0A7X1B057_9BACT|nr:GDSL-type esterase/lipase family protein [Puniceicoccus vermicola]MBC2603190.1 GDSL family lipase [Puniceicoccus vermicola]
MNRKKESVDLVFLGDSITAGWTGAGIRTWNEYFLQYDPVNLGIGGERTQHVLWHIENGFLDEIDPCVVVLMIGTNNLSHHSNQEIAAGITRIVDVIHEKLPKAEVLLLGIFPRGGDPSEKRVREIRERIRKINETISKLDDGEKTRYLDLSANFLDESGQLSREIVPDGLHPNGNGYRVWGQGMASVIDEMMDCDVKTSDRN